MVLWSDGDGGTDTGDAAPAPDALSGFTLECDATGSAAYPVLVVNDIRSATASTAQLWSQFQIPGLNRAMRTPLTMAEVKFAHSTGVGDESKAESESKVALLEDEAPPGDPLSRFDFMFTPSLYGTPPEVVLLQLRNDGELPVSFYFKVSH